jgi:5-methyltetrahydropteroyltriglutamate--homocysteine methyltransferase
VLEAMFHRRRRVLHGWDSDAPAASSCALLPRDKTVVLGLVTTKSGALESVTLAKRIDEATRHVPLERLCLSPQCGFASTHHGNTLTEATSGKLERVLEVTQLVWGES